MRDITINRPFLQAILPLKPIPLRSVLGNISSRLRRVLRWPCTFEAEIGACNEPFAIPGIDLAGDVEGFPVLSGFGLA